MALWLDRECKQLRQVIIVLELAPLTPIKIKRRQNHLGNSEVTQLFSTPPPLHGERVGVSKMLPVPEGEI